jgi:LCP family protein required for cell wall assembly
MIESPAPPALSTRRHKWLKRILVAVLVLANLVVFGGYLALRFYTGKIDAELQRDEEVVAVLSDQPDSGQDPLNFLLIGSDSRENLSDDLEGNFGAIGGERADVIMIVQMLPDDGRLRILSLPRDLRVDIDGHGTDKINAAYAFGGGSLTVKTVKENTGIPIHHYAEIDFNGFAGLVEALGGITLDFPFPARDLKSGFQTSAGRQRLNGAMALGYARSRSYQELQNGQWISVDANDIGRTRRQQQLILAIIAEAKHPSTITEAGTLIETLGTFVTVDTAFDQDSLIDLVWSMRSLNTVDIESVTLSTVTRTIDGSSYQLPEEPAAGAVLAAFLTGEPLAAVAQGPVRVQVLNGNGIPGAAARWAGVLSDDRFVVVDIGDAESDDFATTVFLAGPDRVAQATMVADQLGFGEIRPGTVPEGVDVIVIVGADAQ